MDKGKSHSKKNRKHSGSKSIVSDGSIGGKKVTTPRTRRPSPKKKES